MRRLPLSITAVRIRHRQLQRVIACILLPCYLLACSSWKTLEVSPVQVISEEHPNKVRLTLTDGSTVVLEQPVVSGDTLTGVGEGEHVTIPVSDVTDVAVRKKDIVKTVGLGVLVGVVIVGAVFVAACAAGNFPGCTEN